MSAKSGFTLIELLVVIAIMALIGAYTLSDFGSFGEDQKLKSAVLDIQGQLRTAQTNATTGMKCEDEGGAIWQIQYMSGDIGFMKCKKPSVSFFTLIKPLRLDLQYRNIRIETVVKEPSLSCPDYVFNKFIVDFAPLSGKVGFKLIENGNYSPDCNSLKILVRNSKISPNCTGANLVKCKSLVIEKGGRIYAE